MFRLNLLKQLGFLEIHCCVFLSPSLSELSVYVELSVTLFFLQAYCGFYCPVERKYLSAIATGGLVVNSVRVSINTEDPLRVGGIETGAKSLFAIHIIFYPGCEWLCKMTGQCVQFFIIAFDLNISARILRTQICA